MGGPSPELPTRLVRVTVMVPEGPVTVMVQLPPAFETS